MTLRPAFPELLALATASRPDWDWEETRDAMMAAKHAGWEWDAVFREVIRLVLAEDEAPATLRNSARRPVRPRGVTGPQVNARGRELARELYDNRPAARQEAGEAPDLASPSQRGTTE